MAERKTRRKLFTFIYNFRPFDKRRYPRFNVNCYLGCRCYYSAEGIKNEFPAQIIDVSRVGFLLLTNETKVYPNTKLKVSFKLPTGDKEISIQVRVVRTFRKHMQVWYYSGVEAEDENQEGISLLLDFANQRIV